MKKMISIIFTILISACSSSTEYKTVAVTAEQYGEQWPLTVEGGTLHCEEPTRIVFTASDGQKYGVNGSAAKDYITILEITKDTENMGYKFKMSPDILIDEGLKLCEKILEK